jgi:predicted nucleotidyltransferase
MPDKTNVQQRYQDALEALLVQVKQDSTILAAVLLGSLSYDSVWEKSDIDLLLITQEMRLRQESLCLVEDDIDIHVFLRTRSEFKRILGSATQSSFMHSLLMKGRILFSRDETITELFANREQMGTRDQSVQLLQAAMQLVPSLIKAEKWLRVRHDTDYCFYWILRALTPLATIETVRNGEVTGREVIQQALKFNPDLFQLLYTDLIREEKTPERLEEALETMRHYLRQHAAMLFQPVFAFLEQANGLRSATEINHHFDKQMNLSGVDTVCEWLAAENFLQKLATPVRLTEKSRVDVQEAAYYYPGA